MIKIILNFIGLFFYTWDCLLSCLFGSPIRIKKINGRLHVLDDDELLDNETEQKPSSHSQSGVLEKRKTELRNMF